ncbi:MAG: MBL fold metallo-hydrolase [Acidimicrobiales bacterium]|nr:MBL fold metallo-hydrolase [Acidimicrobiales bacterium]
MVQKQEQEDATDEIAEVAPGILRLQLPIEFTGLGHVNCYALEDERGFALVDPGMPGPTSWQNLMGRLALAEIPLARVHTVVVTHSHPDHFGAAALLAQETGAEIVAHERFRTLFDLNDIDDSELEDADPDADPELLAFLHRLDTPRPSPWGGEALGPPPERLAEMRDNAAAVLPWMRSPRPTKRVGDLERIRLGGREWVGLDTPGHTDDHLCLFDEENGVLLSGDQVLPTITPHISGMVDDALQRFMDSLDRLAGIGRVSVALPAHGHPMTDLAGRVKEIQTHHDSRLEDLHRYSDELGWASVTDLSHKLFKPRSWGGMAEDETYAHLEHLRLHGGAEVREEAGVLLYKLATG